MPGLGTIVNTAAIIAGGVLGMLAKGFIKERFQSILNVALALSVIAMSLAGVVANMLTVSESSFSTRGTYLIIFALVLGGLLGELLDIDGKLERFGSFLKAKTGNAKDVRFVDSFVTASLTVCIGAMAIMGSVMDGIRHDHSILFTKSILDFIIIVVMTASMGKGCFFSAIPVALLQGTVTALSVLIAPLLSDFVIQNISLVGSVLILCIGVNMLCGDRYRIKVANLLPAVVFAVLGSYIPFLA